MNNGSAWTGKHAYTHTHTHNLLVRNQLNTLLFPLGILWFVILNYTLNVLSWGLIHYHLNTNLPTGYISSERTQDTLSVHRRLQTITRDTQVRKLPSSWKPFNQRSKEYIQLMKREDQQDATIRCLLLTSVSTCFGDHYAHLQENKGPVTAFGVLLWFYCPTEQKPS